MRHSALFSSNDPNRCRADTSLGQMRANFYSFGVERRTAALEGVDVELMVINGWSTKGAGRVNP